MNIFLCVALMAAEAIQFHELYFDISLQFVGISYSTRKSFYRRFHFSFSMLESYEKVETKHKFPTWLEYEFHGFHEVLNSEQ